MDRWAEDEGRVGATAATTNGADHAITSSDGPLSSGRAMTLSIDLPRTLVCRHEGMIQRALKARDVWAPLGL
jgi:hypothetical protein